MKANMKSSSQEISVQIPANSVVLNGSLVVPEKAKGIVLFAHGSGSSRRSPRNIYVAGVLNRDGIATVLFDLLTEVEDLTYETRFDIDLLTQRLITVTEWVKESKKTKNLAIGYFGASTGAAAALKASVVLKTDVKAVVSRGGRVDLALSGLPEVGAATLFIVGENDFDVLRLNQEAFEQIEAEKKLAVIPGATHLFEEPGTLEEVAQVANSWFKKYLK